MSKDIKMPNIYDEALEKIKEVQRELNINWGSQPKSWWNVKINKNIEALERAKKVEELLGLYRENSVIIKADVTIKMLEKELEELK